MKWRVQLKSVKRVTRVQSEREGGSQAALGGKKGEREREREMASSEIIPLKRQLFSTGFFCCRFTCRCFTADPLMTLHTSLPTP